MNAAELLRNLLVTPPIEEREIGQGMNIFYAYGVPRGEIRVEMAKVDEVIEGRLPDGLKGFGGILPSRGNGTHSYWLDLNLNVRHFDESRIHTYLFDKSKAMETKEHPLEENVQYQNGVLTFEWKAPSYEPREGIETHIIQDKDVGVTLISKQDPRTARLFTPGVGISPDGNTLEFLFQKGNYWKIVQQIQDGPNGAFSLPGFREVPEELYRRLVGMNSR